MRAIPPAVAARARSLSVIGRSSPPRFMVDPLLTPAQSRLRPGAAPLSIQHEEPWIILGAIHLLGAPRPRRRSLKSLADLGEAILGHGCHPGCVGSFGSTVKSGSHGSGASSSKKKSRLNSSHIGLPSAAPVAIRSGCFAHHSPCHRFSGLLGITETLPAPQLSQNAISGTGFSE